MVRVWDRPHRFDLAEASVYRTVNHFAEDVRPMSLPTLRLDDIPEEGLNLTSQVQQEELTLSATEGVFQDGFSLSIDVDKVGGQVNVIGVLVGTALRQCVRCLKEYEDAVELPFEAVYRPAAGSHEPPRAVRSKPAGREPQPSAIGEEGEGDEDALYALDGDQIDLAGMLREQIILGTPMQPLCDSDCRGLCPVCGQDRNERDCGCADTGLSSPFAVLRQRTGRDKKRSGSGSGEGGG